MAASCLVTARGPALFPRKRGRQLGEARPPLSDVRLMNNKAYDTFVLCSCLRLVLS